MRIGGIALLDELNISFACWSYSNCNEKSAYFKSSCSNAGGDWTADDLTTTGKWLINTCRAHEEKENASYPAVSPSAEPTKAPTVTEKPTAEPTKAPTVTVKPTAEPTKAPTVTEKPTAKPIKTPTPTAAPTITSVPSDDPTESAAPSEKPTITPTQKPGIQATGMRVIASVKKVSNLPVKSKLQLAAGKSNAAYGDFCCRRS